RRYAALTSAWSASRGMPRTAYRSSVWPVIPRRNDDGTDGSPGVDEGGVETGEAVALGVLDQIGLQAPNRLAASKSQQIGHRAVGRQAADVPLGGEDQTVGGVIEQLAGGQPDAVAGLDL